MASLTPGVLESINQLTGIGQVILVINNIRGISEQERAAMKNLALKRDNRLLNDLQLFKQHQDLEKLLSAWRALIKPDHEQTEAQYLISQIDKRNKGFISQVDLEIFLAESYQKAIIGRTEYDNISPNQLALQKSQDIFNSIDKDRDGRISYQEFEKWFNESQQNFMDLPDIPLIQFIQANGKHKSEVSSDDQKKSDQFQQINLESSSSSARNSELFQSRDILGLGKLDATTVIARAKLILQGKDQINIQEFTQLILQTIGKSISGFTQERNKQILARLFKLLDVNQNGLLDREEVLNGLIVLSGGDQENKIQALFMLYDSDGDGLITFDEMLAHQRSVFRIISATQPELISSLGESVETMARVTAESMFQQIDTNNDLVISQDEFKYWYQKLPIPTEVHDDKKRRLQQQQSIIKQMPLSYLQEDIIDKLEEVKRSCGLDSIHVLDAVSIFIKNNISGYFARPLFTEVLEEIQSTFGNPSSAESFDYSSQIQKIFNIFDKDNNGVVDLGELFCGLSLMCSGTASDKLLAALRLFDTSGDGKMQYREFVRYLKSVFHVLLNQQSITNSLSVTPSQLAEATAKQTFKEFGLNPQSNDGLTYSQLRQWFNSTGYTYLQHQNYFARYGFFF